MISVCIATFNGAKYIREQMDSILPQLSENDEIVISDDGSTDSTIEILESYNDRRIIIYKNKFRNVVLNFEFVISQAKGDFIFLSDQDDKWHKDKVILYMKAFEENLNVTLVISNLQIIDGNGKQLDKIFYKNKFNTSLLKNIGINNFIGCAMAFKREVKQTILPFPKNIAMHDWWIGTCCIIYGEIKFIDNKLNFYRRHDNNVTKEGGADFLTKVKWRVNLVINLFLRYLAVNIKPKSVKAHIL